MTVSSTTFIKDITLFTRNFLRTNMTDPHSRTDGVGFVNTSFPKRDTKYPLLTIRGIPGASTKLGMRSELRWNVFNIEIKVFARNVIEVDDLTQTVINLLQKNQYGTGSTDEFEIHDYNITSAVPIEPEQAGDLTIHQYVITIEYKIII